MTLLIIYISLALVFSFLCSIAEAVLLSVTTSYITLLEREGKAAAKVLRRLKQDIDSPLVAILTLNTIAHTVGAVGAGAQAAQVFGSEFVGIASAVLTFLILVFSEIIPKTLGAYYWRKLAVMTAYALNILVKVFSPAIFLAKLMTKGMKQDHTMIGFSREEFAAMAEQGKREGTLDDRESRVLRNLLLFREMQVKDVMTPRLVLFSLSESMTVETFFSSHEREPHSRILVYLGERDAVTGFVLKNDLLLAHAKGNTQSRLGAYRRELPALVGSLSLLRAFDELLEQRSQMMLVVNEYGEVEGIITLEDIFEALLGSNIMDEVDKTSDLRKLARRFGRIRARKMGIKGKKA